jgi:UDP-N-acetylglucosamine acyltransferase
MTEAIQIHPSAVVEEGARIGAGSRIGPFCVIGPRVEIGPQSVLHSHVVVTGNTRIGARFQAFPFAVIGHQPQDLKYRGEESRIEIGDDVVAREHVTVNPGTEGGGMLTSIGNNVLLMVGAHVAHDCHVGNHCLLVNNATLGGHVRVEDHAIIGGLSAVHQWVRIGTHAMIGGMSGVEADVIPYGTVTGERAHLAGLNIVGMKRRGFSREDMHAVRAAYRRLFLADGGTQAERLAAVEAEFGEVEAVRPLIDFVKAEADRALTRPRVKGGAGDAS